MKKLLSVLLFVLASTACGATFQPTEGRTLVYMGYVDQRAPMFGGLVMQLAMQDHTQPIDILLNSDGGDVRMGGQLIGTIDFVEALGVKVRCVNLKHAMSMGFMIMAHCSERYALTTSLSMFHFPLAVLGNNIYSRKTLQELAESLESYEAPFLEDLSKHLNRPVELIRGFAEEEKVWSPEELNRFSPNFYTIVDSISGVPIDL